MELAWHTQKNHMKDVKGKEMEQERKGTISNEDIDLNRTKHNVELVESQHTLYQRVKKRVNELKESGSRVQANSVVMYSNILTVPEEQALIWGEEKTDAYFKACYEFFCNEFGKENVVSAKIHKDETTPHMHLHFVPVNKENGKLQARISMNKAKINTIHDELPQFLQARGFNVSRGSGKTKGKNIEDVHEYKQVQRKIADLEKYHRTRHEILQHQLHQKEVKVAQEIQRFEKLQMEQQESYETYKQNLVRQAEEEVKSQIQAQTDIATAELKQLQQTINLKKKIVENIPIVPIKVEATKEVITRTEKIGILKTNKIEEETGNVIISNEDFERLKTAANNNATIKLNYRHLLTIEPLTENTELKQQNAKLQNENNQLRQQNQTLQTERKSLRQEIDQLSMNVNTLKQEVTVLFNVSRQFLKERTPTTDAFREAFHSFANKVAERLPNSLFKQLHSNSNKRASQQRDLER